MYVNNIELNEDYKLITKLSNEPLDWVHGAINIKNTFSWSMISHELYYNTISQLPFNNFIAIQLKVAALHCISLKMVLLLSIKYHDFMFPLLNRPPPGIEEKYGQAVQINRIMNMYIIQWHTHPTNIVSFVTAKLNTIRY